MKVKKVINSFVQNNKEFRLYCKWMGLVPTKKEARRFLKDNKNALYYHFFGA